MQGVVKSALMAFLGQAGGGESTHEEYFIHILHNSLMRVDLKVRIQRCQLHTRAVWDVSLQSCKRDKRLIDLDVDLACLSNVDTSQLTSDDFVYISKSFQRERQRIYQPIY